MNCHAFDLLTPTDDMEYDGDESIVCRTETKALTIDALGKIISYK